MLTNLKSLIPFEFMDPSTPSHPLRISESKPRLNLRRKHLALYEPYTLKPHFSCVLFVLHCFTMPSPIMST